MSVHVEVEIEQDGQLELLDEASPYSWASSGHARSASAEWVVQEPKQW